MNPVSIFARLLGRGRGAGRPRAVRRALKLEPLETREVPAAFDFGTATSSVAPGYTRVALQTYSAAAGFGWDSLSGLTAFDNGGSNPLTSDVHRGTDRTFLVDVPAGEYDLVATLGDGGAARDTVTVSAEGAAVAAGVGTSQNQFLEVRGRVTVADGQLNLRVQDTGGANTLFAIAGLTVNAVNPDARSLFDASVVPALQANDDPNAVELGVRFQPLANGSVTGVRFYKAAGNGGAHVGSLWSATGQKLASATFTGETASGWQEVLFASPVTVTANTTYTVSYHAPQGRYSNTPDYFAVSGVTNGALRALPNGTGGNGVYRYGASGFPTDTFQATNYFVDVVYQRQGTPDGPPPTADAGPDRSGTEGSAVTLQGAGTGSGVSYAWAFGDGTTGTGANPSHVYEDNGKYTATLTVTDDAGRTATDSAAVTVTNVNPTGKFASSSGPFVRESTVGFSFTNPTDPSATDTAAGFKYSYDFDGDGTWDVTAMSFASSSYTYTEAGTYTARGRIADKDGGSTDYTTTVEVIDQEPPPPPPPPPPNPPPTGGGGGTGTLRTVYVAPTGSDAANGSTATPWKTLQHAANNAKAGDLVVVRAGTYTGFQITTDGTAANRIVFQADPGVLINAKNAGQSAFSGVINLEGADFVTIDGFTVKLAVYGDVRSNIRSVENTGAVIRNNTLDDASWWGVLTGNSANLLVEGNTITDTKIQHGVYIANSADNPVVRGNRIENSRGAGIQINADKDLPGDGIISNALVENNVLLNNCAGESSSLNLNGNEDGVFRNNLIASQFRNGVALYQDNQTTGSKRNKLYGNTVIGSAFYGISISGAGSTDNQVFDNILFSQGWASNFRGGLGVENISGLASDYNVLIGRVNRDPSNTESPAETSTQWKARGFDTNSVFLEDKYGTPQAALAALFVTPPSWPLYSPETGDYRLKAGSPAIDIGLNTPVLPTDLLGAARPAGASTDIGAYEYGATAPVAGPGNTPPPGGPGDTAPPTATVTAPGAGATVSGSVTLTANAADNVGVVGVQFYVDGKAVGAEDTTSPFGVSWNSAAVGNGPHTVTVVARDAAGNATTSSPVTVTTNNPAAGPVAAFGFNEGSGTTARSANGGPSGTISGATWVTGGKFGRALSFNGTNSLVRVADAAALDLTTGATIEAWVRPTTVNGWRTVALKETADGMAYGVYASDEAGLPAGYVNTGGDDTGANGPTALPRNAWSHVAMTFDGSALRVYLNGQVVATRSAAEQLVNGSGPLSIGGNAVWGEYFSGLIDEVRVYNRALTATEISKDMSTPI